jgi:hypothetical protein
VRYARCWLTLILGAAAASCMTSRAYGTLDYIVEYEIHIINNTDSKVEIADGSLTVDADNTVSFSRMSAFCRIPGDIGVMRMFVWEPEYAPIVPDTPRGVRQQPFLRSFYLSVRLGGKKYFLVCCPESVLRSAPPKKGRRMLPRERVLQYGIGYSEGESAEGEPLVIKYANRGQNGGTPFEKRFDRVAGVWTAWAKTRVTINSADDIIFETLSLSLPNEVLSGTLSTAALKETKGTYKRVCAYIREENLPVAISFEELCKFCRDEHHSSITEAEEAAFTSLHSINMHVGTKENVLGLFLHRLKSDIVWKLRMRLYSGE